MKVVETYDYVDEGGGLLFQVIRFEPKTFRPKSPHGTWGLNGARRVPYRLPRVIAAMETGEPVLVVEGERDVHALEDLGLTATCNPGGAKKWDSKFAAYFDGNPAFILPDNDDAGREHAQQMAENLTGAARPVKIVELPSLLDKGDVRDWIGAGGTKEELLRLASEAPETLPSAYREPEGPEGWEGLIVPASEVASGDDVELEYWPFLGRPGFIVKGFSTLLPAYPKVGKTTLLAALVSEWDAAGATVFYITEEPRLIWRQRREIASWQGVDLFFALGLDVSRVMDATFERHHDVVIIDTLRNILQLEQETDNSEVAATVNPWITGARATGKTLIVAHHTTKAGGEHGRAVAGGHALLGSFDASLEIARVAGVPNQRLVKPLARLVSPPEIVYEQTDEGAMRYVGEAQDVEQDTLQQRVLRALGDEWRTRKEIQDDLGEPRPSRDALYEVLDLLTDVGLIARDPQIKKTGATYLYRKPRGDS